MDQHQLITRLPKSSLSVETSHRILSNLKSLPILSSFRVWDLDFQMQHKISAIIHCFHSLAQVRCLDQMSLIQDWLNTMVSASSDSWRTHYCCSLHLANLSNGLWFTIISRLQFSLLFVYLSLLQAFRFFSNFLFKYSVNATPEINRNDPKYILAFFLFIMINYK